MSPSQPIDLTTISQSFPSLDETTLVSRDNLLDTVDSIFGTGISCVVLEGGSGIGKSTLAAQYALRHRASTFTLFIKVSNRWGYDPEALRHDLCGQLYWLIHGVDVPKATQSDDTLLRKLLFDFRKRIRRNNELYRFVIDGLDEIPERDAGHRAVILDLLPLDFEKCRFLFTATDSNDLALPLSLSVKPYPTTAFSLDETRRYLSPLVPQPQLVDDLHAVCRGVPGSLASIRRSVVAGQNPGDALANISKTLTSIFENEWTQVDENSEQQTMLLAILSHDEGIHRISELARLLNLDESTAEGLIKKFSFLTCDHQREVVFTSESFRKFAAGRLSPLKKVVQDRLIDDLLAQPTSQLTSDLLPERLRLAGRYFDLLEYLSPEQIVKTLHRGESIAPARRQVELGVEAALQLDRDADLMRFCMQKSALADSYAIDLTRAEIAARIALNDYASALRIANAVPLKEDRLHLLAIVAKGKRLQGLVPEKELTQQIYSLYHQIDPRNLRDSDGQIASDLVFAAPDLAISLLQASMAEADQGRDEWAFSKISIASASHLTEPGSDSLDPLRAQVTDPRLKQFLSGAALLVGELSAQGVLAEIARFARPKDRLFFLRQWAVRNRRSKDTPQVVEYALKLIIQATEYTPNARDVRQIATPLPFIEDSKVAESLVKLLDAQRGAVEKYGPTVDYLRLQLLLVETEIKYQYVAAKSRIVDAYLYISGIADLSVRLDCLAHLLALLKRIDGDNRIETEEQLKTLTEGDFRRVLADLGASTAEQLRICQGAIQALATTRVDLAMEVASSLNVEPRRDRALASLAEASIRSRRADRPVLSLVCVVDAIKDARVRGSTIVSILMGLSQDASGTQVSYADVAPFVDRAGMIHDPYERCKAYAAAYNLWHSSSSPRIVAVGEDLLKRLRASWGAINAATERIGAGFGIASDLAKTAADVAREFLGLAEQERGEMLLQAPGAGSSYLASLGISVSAFTGLLRRRVDTQSDLSRLAELVSQVPSEGKQIQIWADIAERFYVNQRADDGNQVVMKYVRPLIDRFVGERAGERANVVIAASPALFKMSQVMAKQELVSLTPNGRDEAIAATCSFILKKRAQSDPMETPPGFVFDVTYADITDLLDLLQMMENDGTISSIATRITDSVSSNRHKYRFTQQQRIEIAQKLETLAQAKLPNQRFIRHEGYRVALDADVARIRHSQTSVWEQLTQRAYAIPNIADRVYVLCHVAVSMPDRERVKRKTLLADARQLIEHIPASYDRVERWRMLAEYLWDLDRAAAKDMCKLAVCRADSRDTANVGRLQREVVDFAHRMDPEFATSLVAQFDNDAARVATRAMLDDRVKVLDIKRKMLDVQAKRDDHDIARPASCAVAAWMSLASLNAGRSEPLRPERLRPYIQAAATLPLEEAYPIIAWAVGNVSTRFSNTDQANTFLRPLFEATLLACQMSSRMIARASVLNEVSTPVTPSTDFNDTLFVRAGDRGKALEYIQKWLEESAAEYLKICDPYFGLDDLEVLRLVLSTNPGLRIRILTSLSHQKKERVGTPYDESFRNFWRSHLSAQEPPDTEVVIVGAQGSDALPIHDRWWLTAGAGLRIGTSFKSLGIGKDSEISRLSGDEARVNEGDVDRFLNRSEREHQGARLRYVLFTL